MPPRKRERYRRRFRRPNVSALRRITFPVVTPAPTPDSLSTVLARREAIVGELDRDNVDLDRALALFEEGVRHLKQAKEQLTEAEGRVQRVLEDARGVLSLSDLDV